MMTNGYVSVGKILENSYHIPRYQRGYRWTKENVEKLLEDIYEERLVDKSEINNYKNFANASGSLINKIFNDSDMDKPKSPYCIQPLVVMETSMSDNKNRYDVIDGQQRLTTIAIIRAALKMVASLDSIKTVILSYESRTYSAKYLSDLYENNANNNDNSNIDFDYMASAFKVAKNYFKKALYDINDNEIKKAYAGHLDNILCWNTQFIWYQVDGSDPQKVFANFNTGKIELTNAELIKALFMNPFNYNYSNVKDKQIVISEKWDEIENQLHIPDFWAFIPHRNQYEYDDKDYSTRIDIIFDFLVMNNWLKNNCGKLISDYLLYRKTKISDKYIFNEIESWLRRKLENAKDKDTVMDECWQEVRRVFPGLKELYSSDCRASQSSRIYNMTGLYINLCNREEKVDSYIDDPELYLYVYNELCTVLSQPRDKRKNKLNELIKSSLRIDNIEQKVKSVRYGQGYASSIVKLLLTYNIALLCNSNGIGERFNFLANAQNKWQREHIFASNTDENKTEAIERDRVDERKAALTVIASNSYIEYIKYMFDITEPFKFAYEKNEYELNWNSDEIVQNFINANIAYNGDGQNELLARALKAKRDSSNLLCYYDNIDAISRIVNNEDDSSKKVLLLKYLRSIPNFVSKTQLDISFEDKKIKDSISEKYKNNKKIKIDCLDFEYTIPDNIYNSIVNSGDFSKWCTTPVSDEENAIINFFDLLNKIQDSYINKLGGILIENNDATDVNKLKDNLSNMNDDDFNFLKHTLSLNKLTLEKHIDDFFENDFTRLLKDNSMGNMTLLTGGAGGQNQAVSNYPYGKKKEMVNDFFKSGEFVPLGTIFVFADLYTNGVNSAKFWLPDSRIKYIQEIITTLKNFLGEEDENVQ